jgi:predicted alpha/beta-fold hydrolase
VRNDLDPASSPATRIGPFEAPWWCRGAHAQTLWPYLVRRRPKVPLRRERVELADGDFIDLDWLVTDSRGPIVLILHGLEGSSNSKYALGMLSAVQAHGWRGVVMHFRGCSGEPNRHARGYHSGETNDIAELAGMLSRREPHTPLVAVGYSLGGNVLLKWLGERRDNVPLRAAAAVSVPFVLAESAARMACGFSRVYQYELVQRLKRSIDAKRQRLTLPLRLTDWSTIRGFRDFDEHVTAPLHGFAGADDYYARSSSRQYLKHVGIPALIVHSRDDPFMTPAAVPQPQELSPSVTLEIYERGGHVGFVTGDWPWRARYWLEERIPRFFAEKLKETSAA